MHACCSRAYSPCRFFAEASGTLLCTVHGKRERVAPGRGRQLDYWISDGIYGAARRAQPAHSKQDAPVSAAP